MSIVELRAYRMGRLSFTLSGEGGCVPYLCSELASLREPHSGGPAADGAAQPYSEPRIAFDFVAALPPLVGHSVTRPVYAMQDAFRVSLGNLKYDVSLLAQGGNGRAPSHAVLARPTAGGAAAFPPIYVALRPSNHSRGDRYSVALQRGRDPGFLSTEEKNARCFMYDVFDYLSQLAQLQLGQSYVHASTVERYGEGTALVAWSGVGKTSALVKLITEHGFRYLSDDVALVDDAGTVWRTPKLIQLKAFNVEGDDRLRSMLFRGRSALDRFSWTQRVWRHGVEGARRRVAAEELFGAESVARSAPLKRVYCLERVDIADFDVSEITTAELCRRAAGVVLDVMAPFTFLSQAIHSGHHTPILPTHVQVLEQTSAVLARALRGVPVLNVRIPLAASPSALATYLVRLIEDSESRGEVRDSGFRIQGSGNGSLGKALYPEVVPDP